MTSQYITNKVRRHVSLKMIIGYIVGTALFFAMAYPVITSAEHLIERFDSPDKYYTYIAVKPVKSEFKVGEILQFNSFIHYKRNISIRWEDTLFCEQNDGVKKYTTQFWPEDGSTEKKFKGYVNMTLDSKTGIAKPDTENLSYWEIYIHQPDPEATVCYVCGVAVGYTSKGYPKPHSFCTETVRVNK